MSDLLIVDVTVSPKNCGATFKAETVLAGLAAGDEYARLLLSNDPARERAEIKVIRVCSACDGTGRLRRKRSRWTYDDCKVCAKSGVAEVLAHQVLTRTDVENS